MYNVKKMDQQSTHTQHDRLFGMTILQAQQYYSRYPNDSLVCKTKVGATFSTVFETDDGVATGGYGLVGAEL